MGDGRALPCGCARGKRRQGGIKSWPCAILASAGGILAQSGAKRALVLQGTQLITVSTSLWGSKYTGINTESSEKSVYCITATEILMPLVCSLKLGFPTRERFNTHKKLHRAYVDYCETLKNGVTTAKNNGCFTAFITQLHSVILESRSALCK